jgi:carboxymethylenebutenolidase
MHPIARSPLALALALTLSACASTAARPAADDAAHLAAMAHEHGHETPTPNASDQPPRQEVTAEEVTYFTLDGHPVRGYYARLAHVAEGQRLPGIVVIHEWWGLNDNVRVMTRRLAGEGYQALAVDLYGRTATTPDAARALMGEAMATPDRLVTNLRAATAFLQDAHGAPRLGVVGWCFGGAWSLQTALREPARIDAAVMYYGRTVTDRTLLGALDAPLLGLFGEDDQGIPVAGVREMETALRELHKDVTVQVYPGAGHAFANPSGQSYRAAAADDAWQRVTAFFARHLQGG